MPKAPSNAFSVAFAAFRSVSSVSMIVSTVSSTIAAGFDCPGRGTEDIASSSLPVGIFPTCGNCIDCSNCCVTFGAAFLTPDVEVTIDLDKSIDEPANTEIGKV